MQHTAWKDFNTGVWDKAIDVRDFIQRNYVPYEGDDYRAQKCQRAHL